MLNKYQELLKGINLAKGITIGNRTFVGPKEVMEQVGKLEELYRQFKSLDILQLYNESVAHNGEHDEDIYHSGRYFAYLVFELKGQSREEKKEILVKALSDIVEKHGEETTLKYFPDIIKGRQVTENLSIRPEDDDYPSNYSKSRTEYAKNMSKEEIPETILEKIKEEQDVILDKYDWYTLFVESTDGKLIKICDNFYLTSDNKIKNIENFASIWNFILKEGIDTLYNFNVATDGEYPQDKHNPLGRYFAYVNFELKGQSHAGKLEFLKETLPEKVLKNIDFDIISSIFPMQYKGDLVTQSLTLRPENDEFPSHFNEKKVKRGEKKGFNQILFNIQAEILKLVEERLGEINKIIILVE